MGNQRAWSQETVSCFVVCDSVTQKNQETTSSQKAASYHKANELDKNASRETDVSGGRKKRTSLMDAVMAERTRSSTRWYWQ